jgi:TRAP-type uncharacterized transport system fused permease subunit
MNDTAVKYQSDESGHATRRARLGGLGASPASPSFSLFQLYQMGIGLMPAQNLRAIHLAFALGADLPALSDAQSWDMSRLSIYRCLLAASRISGPLYFYFNFNAWSCAPAPRRARPGMGVLTIARSWRRRGAPSARCCRLIAIAFMLTPIRPYMPELIAHRGYSPERIIRHLYPTTEGIFGIPLAVASTFVFLFVCSAR